MASQAERDMRDLVVQRLRKLRPEARIIHEVNCWGSGSPRVDVMAVSPDELVGVEIKSERDTLDRLALQVKAFRDRMHLVLCVHGVHRQNPEYPRFRGDEEWPYPVEDLKRWTLHRFRRTPAASSNLLGMLWHEELASIAARHTCNVTRSATRGAMITVLALDLTGREVRREVCRCLRLRRFAEADPPIEDAETEVA